MSRPNCPRGWVGCNFEPRYDLGPPTITEITARDPKAATAFMEASRPKTYVRDVCARCGATIERS